MAFKGTKLPHQYSVPHGGKISKWILDWLRAHPRPKDTLIEEAVIKQYNLKEPDVNKTTTENDHEKSSSIKKAY